MTDETIPRRPPFAPSDSAGGGGGGGGGGGVEIAPGVRVPESSLRVQFARGGGPGGQNVNKLNTKAELWVPLDELHAAGVSRNALHRLTALAGRRVTDAGELHLVSETHRRQELNRKEVFARLRELLIRAMVEPKLRRKTRPSRAARERRLEAKKRRGQIKARRQGRE
jgi:ribosome-associated protein